MVAVAVWSPIMSFFHLWSSKAKLAVASYGMEHRTFLGQQLVPQVSFDPTTKCLAVHHFKFIWEATTTPPIMMAKTPMAMVCSICLVHKLLVPRWLHRGPIFTLFGYTWPFLSKYQCQKWSCWDSKKGLVIIHPQSCKIQIEYKSLWYWIEWSLIHLYIYCMISLWYN